MLEDKGKVEFDKSKFESFLKSDLKFVNFYDCHLLINFDLNVLILNQVPCLFSEAFQHTIPEEAHLRAQAIVT